MIPYCDPILNHQRRGDNLAFRYHCVTLIREEGKLTPVKFEESFLQHMPEKWRAFFIKHREFIRFAVVGGITFIIDNAVFYALTLTVMHLSLIHI